VALNEQILEIEKQMAVLKERVAMEKKLLPRINEFKSLVLAQQEEFRYIQTHLPARLPGKAPEPLPVPLPELEKIHPPAPLVEAQETVVTKKTDAKKVGSQPPTLSYVTVDELENTPKYIKGRLTLDKVNAGVDEVQKLVDSKYKILSLPIAKMNDKMLRKYKMYKDMETAETKGLFFIAEQDLADTTHIKQGDATGKAIISVLRHVHRLKDLGGATKRLAIIG